MCIRDRVYAEWTVPIEYDPLLAKVSVWGETRESAIQRMRRAVAEYRIIGMTTNLRLFERLMADDQFIAGNLNTAFLDEFMNRLPAPETHEDGLVAAILAAAHSRAESAPVSPEALPTTALWRIEGRRGLLR